MLKWCKRRDSLTEDADIATEPEIDFNLESTGVVHDKSLYYLADYIVLSFLYTVKHEICPVVAGLLPHTQQLVRNIVTKYFGIRLNYLNKTYNRLVLNKDIQVIRTVSHA